MIKAQAANGKIIQVGSQSCSFPTLINAVNQVREGLIGNPYRAKSRYANSRKAIGVGKAIPVPSTLDFDLWQGPAPRKEYKDNLVHYNLRGRIWGPMNFLVYLGLKNYDLPEACKILAEKSNILMMENVRLNTYIYENYNAITGNVKDPAEGKRMGDNYYHWGALLGFVALMEKE